MQIDRDKAEYVSTIRKVQSLMKIKKRLCMSGEEDDISCSVPTKYHLHDGEP